MTTTFHIRKGESIPTLSPIVPTEKGPEKRTQEGRVQTATHSFLKKLSVMNCKSNRPPDISSILSKTSSVNNVAKSVQKTSPSLIPQAPQLPQQSAIARTGASRRANVPLTPQEKRNNKSNRRPNMSSISSDLSITPAVSNIPKPVQKATPSLTPQTSPLPQQSTAIRREAAPPPPQEKVIKKHEIQKRIKKCKAMGIPSGLVKSSKLESLFFKDHIYERMKSFDLLPKLEKGEIKFPYLAVTNLHDIYSSVVLHQKEFFEECQRENVSFLIRRDTGNGSHFKVMAKDINFETFKSIQGKQFQNLKNIEIIEQTKFFSAPELCQEGLLRLCTDGYRILPGIDFLSSGFQKVKVTEKSVELIPYKYLTDHNKKFYLDVVVHSKGQPGVFGNQGHASLRLTSANGMVYSVGNGISRAYNKNQRILIGDSAISSPDIYEFIPNKASEKRVRRYEILNPKDFHKLFDFVEKQIQQTFNPNDKRFVYHALKQNCSHFCKDTVTFALENLSVDSGTLSYSDACRSTLTTTKMSMLSGVTPVISLLESEEYEADTVKYKESIRQAKTILPASLLHSR